MTKKPLVISIIVTALAGISKIVGSALATMASNVATSISGAAPTKPSGILGYLTYGPKMVAFGARKAAAATATAPLKAVSAIFSFLGKLLIPLIVITIVILVITIVMSMLKKRTVSRKLRARHEDVQYEDDKVYTGVTHGSDVDVFTRLR